MTLTATTSVAQAFEAGPITAIETIRWRAQPNILWVRMKTASGLVGLGETYYIPGAAEAVIHDMAAPLLLGEEAGNVEVNWRNLFACANFSGFAGAEMRAFSALDIAAWDVFGKATGRPIHKLLGGPCRTEIPIYATCANAGGHMDQDRFLDDPEGLVRELLDSGVRALKVWPWDRFAPQIRGRFQTGPAGWSAMGPVGHLLSRRDLDSGLSVVRRIREAVGDDIEILIEGHSRWDVNCAVSICRALEPYNPLWVEDIIQPDNPDDLARIVNETRVPQAVSERLISKHPFRQVLERHAAHVIMLDVAWVGGITESRKVASMADAYHLSVAPHDCTGPVTAFANLHLAGASPNAMITEMVRGFVEGYYLDVVDDPLPISGGVAALPTRPGLGTDLRGDFLERDGISMRSSEL